MYQCALGGKTSLPVVLTPVGCESTGAAAGSGSGVLSFFFSLSFSLPLPLSFAFTLGISSAGSGVLALDFFSCFFLDAFALVSLFLGVESTCGCFPSFKPCKKLETSFASSG